MKNLLIRTQKCKSATPHNIAMNSKEIRERFIIQSYFVKFVGFSRVIIAMPIYSRPTKTLNMRTIKPIYRLFAAMLLIAAAAMGQMAHATTVTYTYQGTSSGMSSFIGHFIASGDITGNYPETNVVWNNDTTNELIFDLADGITLTIKNTTGYGIQGTSFLAIRGNSTLTVSNSNYYITHIKAYDPKGRVIQFDAEGQQVNNSGVTEFDFYNVEQSYSRDIMTTFTFAKI